MKVHQRNTGTGVTVFAILALTLCLSGTAGSKSEYPIFPKRAGQTTRDQQTTRADSAQRKEREALRNRGITRKKQIAAMAYFWYVLAKRNPS